MHIKVTRAASAKHETRHGAIAVPGSTAEVAGGGMA
jgi:hypothetical protein